MRKLHKTIAKFFNTIIKNNHVNKLPNKRVTKTKKNAIQSHFKIIVLSAKQH